MSVRSYLCATDLSAHLHKFVRLAPDGRTIQLNTAAGTPNLGVLKVTYTDGLSVWGVVTDGPDIQQILAGGAFSITDPISNDATARAVKTSNLAGSVVAGIAMRAAAAAGDLVEYQPFTDNDSSSVLDGLITSSSADGAALTAAARASMTPAANRVTIPGGTFDELGTVVVIEATGEISSVITTPGTARYDVAMGAAVVFDGLAAVLDSVAAHVVVGWFLRIVLSLRAVGAVASFMGAGFWTTEDLLGVPATAPKGNLTAMLPWDADPTIGATFDAGADLVLDTFFTQTVATGSMTCNQYTVRINKPSQRLVP